MKFKTFILHLPRSTRRRKNALKLQNVLPGPAEIFQCVDGRSLTKNTITENYKRNIFRPYYPFKLNVGEIGLFLTFRKLWRKIVDEEIDVALISEDDVAVDNECFDVAFDLAYEFAQERGQIKFGHRPLRACLSKIMNGNHALAVEKTVPLGTQCQLITKQSAKNLLLLSNSFDRPVDCYLQLVNYTGETISTIWPAGIKEISSALGGSSIHRGQVKLSPLVRLSREIKRSKYRLSVRCLHKQSLSQQ